MFTKLFYREGEALLVFGCKALWDILQDSSSLYRKVCAICRKIHTTELGILSAESRIPSILKLYI